MPGPKLSVVVLTWNEHDQIGPCLEALAAQTCRDFEIIVVDAASTDGTVAVVEQMRPRVPVPLRVEAATRRLPIGEARNRGRELARAPAVAFVSADTQLERDWVARALAGLQDHDMVFGFQSHTPRRHTVAASVRSLRYHFPEAPVDDPAPYASNVAAAYRKEVLDRFPFDAWTDAAEDLLLAKRAMDAGFTAHYDPRMRVMHLDVESHGQEMRKNVREGIGCGRYHRELGLQRPLLAWGGALVVAAAVRHPMRVPLLLGLAYAPALRRAWRHRHDMRPQDIGIGLLASPLYDLAFLTHYLRGLAQSPEKET